MGQDEGKLPQLFINSLYSYLIHLSSVSVLGVGEEVDFASFVGSVVLS